MSIFQLNKIIFCGLTTLIFFLFAGRTMAQESNSTKRKINLGNERQQMLLRRQLDRSVSGGMMTGMGTYRVPTEKQYYTPPFKGQYYLDLALEAYRKELENKIGANWYWKFLETISPFINNRFEFGFYKKDDLEFVDRDHPLLESDLQD